VAVGTAVGSVFRRIGGGVSWVWGALRGLSLVLAGVGVLALIASAPLYLLVPELATSAIVLAGVGVFLLLVALLTGMGQVRSALGGKRGRYGSNTVVMVIAFVGVMVVANLLGVRQSYRLDLTVNKEFSLSGKTTKVLDELKAPVHALAFLVPGDPTRETTENLLREYAHRGSKFTYEMVDPDSNPALTRQYEVSQYGTIVFDSEGHRANVPSQISVDIPDPSTGQTKSQVAPNPTLEQDVTAAVLKVTGLKRKRVYFLTGHGEADINDTQGQQGYGLAAQGLVPDNYEMVTLSLATVDAVPEDAAALIAPGPRQDLLTQEQPLLADYLRRQGKLLLLADPATPASWNDLLAPWGVALSGGRVVDEESYAFPDKGSPAVQRTQYLLGPVTKSLDTTFFPNARAIDITGILSQKVPEQSGGAESALPVQMVDMGLTSRSSWTETSSGDPKFDRDKDTPGPLPLVTLVAATAPIGEKPPASQPTDRRTRLVVVGNSAFASNQFFYSLGNSDLFLNSVNWLSEEEELISIRPKPFAFRRLVVTQRAWNWILYSSIAFLPLLVSVVGVFTWWRRR